MSKQSTNNDIQNTTPKTKDQATRTPLKTVRVCKSCSTSDTRCVNVKRHEHHRDRKMYLPEKWVNYLFWTREIRHPSLISVSCMVNATIISLSPCFCFFFAEAANISLFSKFWWKLLDIREDRNNSIPSLLRASSIFLFCKSIG